PLTAAAVSVASDPINDNPPISSGIGIEYLSYGQYYTELTRDDVAGFRYLLRAANVNTENPSPDAVLQTGSGTIVQLNTSDLGLLASTAAATDPVTLTNEFPGLQIVSVTTNYAWLTLQTNIVTYLTNFPGSAYGSPPTAVATTSVTPLVPAQLIPQYSYVFGNVITNSYSPVASAMLMTVSNLTFIKGAFNGNTTNALGTNIVTLTTTNFPSGDYYIIPPGVCGYSILQLGATNVFYTTNLVETVTNGDFFVSQSIIFAFTNHSYLAQKISCAGVTNVPAGRYEGMERMQFVYVDPGNYDSFTGRFIVPITNNYTMSLVVHTNGVDTVVIQNFKRVINAPDFTYAAEDTTTAGGVQGTILRTAPNWNQSNILPTLAGPGTIDPTNASIAYNSSGPVYENQEAYFLNGPNYGSGFIYASFDGSTNVPVVYPNGTSITNLENQVFIQVSPSDLPVGTHGVAYSATFTVTGGQAPYNWSLATGSFLPAGFTLSANGLLSGTTTQTGVFDFSVQMTDSATPAHTVQREYTLTIN
ncbi:MAG TPA: hypothetical protein VGO57_13430, partial [Verrucomicrobiae bacterium]